MSARGPRRASPLEWLIALLLVRLERRRERRARRRERALQAPVPGVPLAERELASTARAERATLAALGLAALGGVAFALLYVLYPDTQLLGLALGGALVALAAASILAGKRLVPQEQAVEERSELADPAAQDDVAAIVRRAGDGISRRRLLIGAAGAAGATVGGAALVPAASLGPRVGERLAVTPWRAGRRVVDADDRPIRIDDVEEGAFHTGFPEGADRRQLGAPVVLVRVPPRELDVPAARRAAMPEGVVAFSKVCPHAGCAVSMYRHPRYEPTAPGPALVCPCHFSTFDVRRGGAVIFGPAGRALPQLPLRVGARRELEAAGDFLDRVGPSWSGVRQGRPRA